MGYIFLIKKIKKNKPRLLKPAHELSPRPNQCEFGLPRHQARLGPCTTPRPVGPTPLAWPTRPSAACLVQSQQPDQPLTHSNIFFTKKNFSMELQCSKTFYDLILQKLTNPKIWIQLISTVIIITCSINILKLKKCIKKFSTLIIYI